MTLADVYCPPVPRHWNRPARIIIEEGRAFTPAQLEEREERRKAKEADKRTTYYREWIETHRTRTNERRRERYAATKEGQRQEEMRAAAVRTMVAMGGEQ